MKTLSLIQGSPEWHNARANHFTASEAPAMMGVGWISRDDLLKLKKTGISDEITPGKRALFDKGHAAEAAARPIIEELFDVELFPVTGSEEIEGLSLLASFDGLTMMNETVFEHKLFSEKLAAQVRNGKLDPKYYWQLEQQILIAGAERAIFVVSDGTSENMVHMIYEPVRGRAKKLLAGWKQFAKDLEAFEVTVPVEKPEATTISQLPALSIQIEGRVLSTNLDAFKTTALQFIDNINTDLQTDQDFADAEAMVKFCSNAEKELDTVKKMAQAQAVSIDQIFRAIDDVREQMRQKRLTLEKLVKSEKELRKNAIIQKASDELRQHIESINDALSPYTVGTHDADFYGVIKGKSSLANIQAAVNDEVAKEKIRLDEHAEIITANSGYFAVHAAGHETLFPDIAQLVHSDSDYFALLIDKRISDHKAAEEKRLAEERERQEAESKQAVVAPHKPSEPVAAVQVSPKAGDNAPGPFARWWENNGDRFASDEIEAACYETWLAAIEWYRFNQGAA